MKSLPAGARALGRFSSLRSTCLLARILGKTVKYPTICSRSPIRSSNRRNSVACWHKAAQNPFDCLSAVDQNRHVAASHSSARKNLCASARIGRRHGCSRAHRNWLVSTAQRLSTLSRLVMRCKSAWQERRFVARSCPEPVYIPVCSWPKRTKRCQAQFCRYPLFSAGHSGTRKMVDRVTGSAATAPPCLSDIRARDDPASYI
jgi:hypothetical protein